MPNIYFGFVVELSDVVFCGRSLVLRAVYSANIAGFTTVPTHLVRIVKVGFRDVQSRQRNRAGSHIFIAFPPAVCDSL